MGDRAVIVFTSEDQSAGGVAGEISPVIYLHWGGSEVRAVLRETFELMETRGADVSYTAARFCGCAHVTFKGNLSLGLWNSPKTLAEIRERTFSHGDAGVFLVHLDRAGWTIEMLHGYGFGNGLVHERWTWSRGMLF